MNNWTFRLSTPPALLGYATLDIDHPGTDMSPLLQTIIDKVPPPPVSLEGLFPNADQYIGLFYLCGRHWYWPN